jgi:hypothetical protein
MPLSGALPNYCGDIAASIRGVVKKLECKRRGRAFGTLYSLTGQSYALVIRDDHADPLVVMRLDEESETVIAIRHVTKERLPEFLPHKRTSEVRLTPCEPFEAFEARAIAAAKASDS